MNRRDLVTKLLSGVALLTTAPKLLGGTSRPRHGMPARPAFVDRSSWNRYSRIRFVETQIDEYTWRLTKTLPEFHSIEAERDFETRGWRVAGDYRGYVPGGPMYVIGIRFPREVIEDAASNEETHAKVYDKIDELYHLLVTHNPKVAFKPEGECVPYEYVTL